MIGCLLHVVEAEADADTELKITTVGPREPKNVRVMDEDIQGKSSVGVELGRGTDGQGACGWKGGWVE